MLSFVVTLHVVLKIQQSKGAHLSCRLRTLLGTKKLLALPLGTRSYERNKGHRYESGARNYEARGAPGIAKVVARMLRSFCVSNEDPVSFSDRPRYGGWSPEKTAIHSQLYAGPGAW